MESTMLLHASTGGPEFQSNILRALLSGPVGLGINTQELRSHLVRLSGSGAPNASETLGVPIRLPLPTLLSAHPCPNRASSLWQEV